MSAPFRWESRCLSDDPFAGDFGSGEIALSDKMVTNRKGGICHTCAGECEPGTRNRVLTERDEEGGLSTYRWCQQCCFTMAVYDIRPSLADARFSLGEERRRIAPIEAFGRDATRLDGEATKAGNSSKPSNIGETNDR